MASCAHGPPQSTPVSPPFWTLSLQVGAAQAPLAAPLDGLLPCVHTPLVQSPGRSQGPWGAACSHTPTPELELPFPFPFPFPEPRLPFPFPLPRLQFAVTQSPLLKQPLPVAAWPQVPLLAQTAVTQSVLLAQADPTGPGTQRLEMQVPVAQSLAVAQAPPCWLWLH